MQRTLLRSVHATGVGLHSGHQINLRMKPADVGSGVVFRRLDLAGSPEIPARVENVVDTRLATTLGVGNATVSTVEHLLAALWACEVDNIVLELDGPEVPVLDGSSMPWVALLRDTGFRDQGVPRRVLRVRQAVQIQEGNKFAGLAPAPGLFVRSEIEFTHPAIGRQRFEGPLDGDRFVRELAAARTFGFQHEVDALRAKGLARGGSLDNAVVIDAGGVVNPEGLRFADEFVRHKVLDAVGDLSLLGARLQASITLERSGHAMHLNLCKALMSRPEHYEWVHVEAPRRPRSAEVNGRRSLVPA